MIELNVTGADVTINDFVVYGETHPNYGTGDTFTIAGSPYQLDDIYDISQLRNSTELKSYIDSGAVAVIISGSVVSSDALTSIGMGNIIYESPDDYSNLRILSYLDGVQKKQNIENIDYTILGLTKASPLHDKGRKATASYYEAIGQTNTVVKKTFTDYDEVGEWAGIEILHEWRADDDTVKRSKSIKKPLNKEERGNMKKKRRERQISGLVSRAAGTAGEPLVDAIFSWYKDQKEMYLNTGSSVLADDINAETDATMLVYLAILVPVSWDVAEQTIKDAILYEIT